MDCGDVHRHQRNRRLDQGRDAAGHLERISERADRLLYRSRRIATARRARCRATRARHAWHIRASCARTIPAQVGIPVETRGRHRRRSDLSVRRDGTDRDARRGQSSRRRYCGPANAEVVGLPRSFSRRGFPSGPKQCVVRRPLLGRDESRAGCRYRRARRRGRRHHRAPKRTSGGNASCSVSSPVTS